MGGLQLVRLCLAQNESRVQQIAIAKTVFTGSVIGFVLAAIPGLVTKV